MATSVLSRRCMARMIFCVTAAALVSALCFLNCGDGDKGTSTVAYTLTTEASPASGGAVVAVPSLPSYKAGTNVTLTAEESAGYMFLGWQVDAEAMDTANPIIITIDKDITAYAVFTQITYAVTYDANGGTDAPAAQTKTYGVALALSGVIPEQTGYTFTGWNTQADGSGTVYGAGASYAANSDLTLYAQWVINTYAVTYNAGGSEDTPAAQTKTYDIPLKLSSTTPTKTGFTFSGWNTQEDGTGTAYAAGANYTDNAAVTLYAQWALITYAVTYDANGGTDAPAAQAKLYGAALTLISDAPAKTGYAFSGWNTSADGAGTYYGVGASYTVDAAVTLYAQWTAHTYTVTYNVNGGTGAPAAQAKAHDVALTLSAAPPTRTGFVFAGWNTQADGGGTAYSTGASYAANADITLYAKWVAAYTITYNANGGSNPPAAQTKTHDVALTLSAATPTRAGFTFTKWNTLADGTGTPYAAGESYPANANANIILYAQWTTAYTVTYDATEGTGAPEPQTKTQGVALTLSNTKPTREHYTFTKWTTNDDGSGDTYSAGGSYAADADVTLYAQWAPINTITYYANGSNVTGMPDAQTKIHGESLTLSNTTPTRKGYDFTGWNTLADGTGTNYAAEAEYAADADLALYAQWTIKTYTVTFNSVGGSPVTTQNIDYEGTATEPNEPTRADFVFRGWYRDSEFANPWDFGVDVVTSDTVLYAKWAETYTITYGANGDDVTGIPGAQEKVHGEPLTLSSETPTRTGYDFSGWNTLALGGGSDYAAGGSYEGNGNVTLYAQWTPKAYNVTYNLVSVAVTDVPNSQTKYHDIPLVLSHVVPLHTGGCETFKGWSTANNGPVVYNPGDTYNNNAPVELWAIWMTTQYIISFDANGGNVNTVPTNQIRNCGATGFKLSTNKPTKDGNYSFTVWNTQPDGGGKNYAAGGTVPTADNGHFTLYAQWSPDLITNRTGEKNYRTVTIGSQTWMAENLNYTAENGNTWCYNEDSNNCETHGSLYDWEGALEACPVNWHLPTNDEWQTLVDNVGGATTAGGKLRSTSGWSTDNRGFQGTDEFGFTALPSGLRYANGAYGNINNNTAWWTATEVENNTQSAMYWTTQNNQYNMSSGSVNKSNFGRSVRCVKDP